MKIRAIKKTNKALEEFLKMEWKKADLTHFGQAVDWTKKEFHLKVTKNRKTVGYVKFAIEAGVCNIQEIIVAHDHQGQGIGRELMKETEKIAKESKVHKITLSTGKGWPAEKFYQSGLIVNIRVRNQVNMVF